MELTKLYHFFQTLL